MPCLLFFFSTEKARQTEFTKILGRHVFHMAIVGTSYCADVDMRCNGFLYLIGELKDEMGSKGAEPVFLSVYYTAHLRQQKRFNPRSPLPCLVLYLIGDGPCMLFESINSMSPAGTTLGFIGLAFTDRTNIQVPEQHICLDYHHTDVKLRTMTARYFGMLRKATDKLKRYYKYDSQSLKLSVPLLDQTPDYLAILYTTISRIPSNAALVIPNLCPTS